MRMCLDLYPRVPVGMRVTVTWQHFSTQAVTATHALDPSCLRGQQCGRAQRQQRPASTSRKVSDGSLGSLFF